MKMHISAVVACIMLTAGAATVSTTASAHTAESPGDAAAVRNWNSVTMTTLVTSATPAVEQPLHLAAVHRAIYDAVRATVDREGRVSVSAAISRAAHDVLAAEFPSQLVQLDGQLVSALSSIPVGRPLTDGLEVGHRAALRALDERAGDGQNGPVVPVPPPAPGVWSPKPPNTLGASSWLGAVRPFALATGSDLRPAGPPSLTSSRWARDYNETRLLGSATSTTRTAVQTEVARFWSDPPLVQNQRGLRDYTESNHFGVLRTAKLFAYADTASADALIACFDAKYYYEFWRPFAAIPSGDADGNPNTPADPTWVPLLPTPNFPEYPSAHSCSTTAIATVVAALAPGHRFDFTLTSVATGTSHHYSSVRELTDEVANARVWGGLHWRFATDDGTRLGLRAALAVLKAEIGRR